jgi:hypothetical protein
MTPVALEARYVRALIPLQVTLHQPGKTVRAPRRVITGRLLGEMHARGKLHHYRVAADDGVLHLAPPGWLSFSSLSDVRKTGLTISAEVQEKHAAVCKVLIEQRKAEMTTTSVQTTDLTERLQALGIAAQAWGLSTSQAIAYFQGRG